MKYKVGDKVRIKSLDWYNANKNKDGIVELSTHIFVQGMSQFCGKVVTIEDVFEDIDDNVVYYMEEIDYDWTDEMIDCLVDRNGKTYPYKIGDRVVLKGNNRCATITDLKYNSWGNLSYYIKIDNDKDISIDYPTDLLLPYDNMVECKVEEETSIDLTVKGEDVNERIEIAIPEGYEYAIESGKIIFNKKKKEYPKTYEECLSVLKIKGYDIVTYVPSWTAYEKALYQEVLKLRELIICRDAYWKIAGEEMSLGKPWEPSGNEDCFIISRSFGEVFLFESAGDSETFEFPTREMRDAFYENFKELINECKELL